MFRFWALLFLLVTAGCGEGENAVAVTSVMADTRGTYRLVTSQVEITSASGTTRFASFSSGTLRLKETDYTMSLAGNGGFTASGSYHLGASANTVLNSRQGAFSLSSNLAPSTLAGSYFAQPDFYLTLNYVPYALVDSSTVVRTETWRKLSDSPRYGLD
ncbi:hypothetical protein GMLC_35010 [Geomonas limicola]|uniref:Lipoprotein n=1 Tax=Geomonas limicola TaxID=2740186 RepID=A0A6V8NBB5_9BACT|nr:hypothetical protein [Geomonas limicola]GFO69922.1 hypothetical protein GMLC_35010 [Geomonas limicola]